MVKKLIKYFLVTVLALITLVVVGPWALYLYGLQALPSDTSPTNGNIPPVVLQALWISETNTTTMLMKPVSIWDWVIMFITAHPEDFTPSFRVAGLTARVLVSRDTIIKPQRLFKRQVRELAVAIWVNQHWTAEEALRTILAGSYFGHGFYGLSNAAQGYFGLPTRELSIGEAAVLTGLIRAPSRYDPWCQPERSRAFVEALVAKLKTGINLSPRLLPPPAGACN